MKAAGQQMIDVIKHLVKIPNLDINKADKQGLTALAYSIKNSLQNSNDQIQVAKVLLENGGNPNTLYIEEIKGEQPIMQSLLHIVVKNQLTEHAKLLIDFKADVNAIDKKGDTAVHLAARKKGKAEILEFLLQADPNLKIQNLTHQTALGVATEDKKKMIQNKIQEQEAQNSQIQSQQQSQQQYQQQQQQVQIQQNKGQQKQTTQGSIQNSPQNKNKQSNSTLSSPSPKKYNYDQNQWNQNIDSDKEYEKESDGQQGSNQKSDDDSKQLSNQQTPNLNSQGDQAGQYQNKYNLQIKKQLSQNSSSFQMINQLASNAATPNLQPSNPLNSGNMNLQQSNFSSPQPQYNNNMQPNIKPINTINNSNINNSTQNGNKGQQQQQQFYPNQQQQQYQNFQNQNIDRNKNVIQQQPQLNQQLNGTNRVGAINYNYAQINPMNQGAITNQIQQPQTLNGNIQQQQQVIYPNIQKPQTQTPPNPNPQQSTPQINGIEDYPLWPESMNVFEKMKNDIVIKSQNNPNKITIDISDESKRNELNQNAKTDERNNYRTKYKQKDQEFQALNSKYQELLKQYNSLSHYQREQNTDETQTNTQIISQINNSDPLQCSSNLLDWDMDYNVRQQAFLSINYFKNTQMLNKKELLPNLNTEIEKFEKEVNEYNKNMESIFDDLIKKVEDIIKQQYPQIRLLKYGSYATKLCLPWSDIDIVIDTQNTEPLNTQQSFLKIIENLLLVSN